MRYNNNYLCEDDFITYETIENPDNCLSIGDNMCVTCDTASQSRSSNSLQFNKSPIQTIFNVERGAEADAEFWKLLEEKCGINRPSTSLEELKDFYIALPEFDKLDDYANIIQNRIEEYVAKGLIKDKNTSNFIRAI